jgi:outer membrane protein OmpA-like peptidoglycan-associated protein
MARILAAISAVMLLASCAQTREWYVVMPEPDGRVGTVVVTRDGRETVLNGAYSSTRSGSDAAAQADPAEVQKAFAAALQAAPVRPASFTLFFRGDSDQMTPQSRADLPRIASEIMSRPAPEVTLVGHADTTESPVYNDALSMRRADRVRAELERLGVAPASITVQGRGERELLVPTPDDRHDPRNRRVEIEVR